MGSHSCLHRCRICQEAVETILCGGTISVILELLPGTAFPLISTNESTDANDGSYTFHMCNNILSIGRCKQGDPPWFAAPHCSKRMKPSGGMCPVYLGLSLTTRVSKDEAEGEGKKGDSWRPRTPSMNSEESVTTTTCFERSSAIDVQPRRLLNLFD